MNKLPVPQPARFSYAKHRRDVNRQIVLPVAFVTVMVGVLAALILFAGNVSKWSAIAIIWMAIPLMLLMPVVLAVAWGVVYLLGRLLKVSPRYTGIAQAYVLQLNVQIVLWADKIILPLIQLQAWLSLFS